MACITTENFGVLTNGLPSCFLKASQGSLSPLLILIVIEGMGRMISAAHSRGSFSGMGITRNIFITHLILWMMYSYLGIFLLWNDLYCRRLYALLVMPRVYT